MQVHKITLYVIDFESMWPQSVAETIENQKYPNYCIRPSVIGTESADIGEWSDDHPLNNSDLWQAEIQRLFG